MTKEEIKSKIEEAEQTIIQLTQTIASLELQLNRHGELKKALATRSVQLLNYYNEQEIIHSIVRMVCRIYNLEEENLLRSRSPKPFQVRYIMFHVINKLTTLTYVELSHILKVDRTTIRRGVVEMDGYVSVGHKSIKRDYEIIEGAIQAFLRTHQDLIPFLKSTWNQ